MHFLRNLIVLSLIGLVLAADEPFRIGVLPGVGQDEPYEFFKPTEPTEPYEPIPYNPDEDDSPQRMPDILPPSLEPRSNPQPVPSGVNPGLVTTRTPGDDSPQRMPDILPSPLEPRSNPQPAPSGVNPGLVKTRAPVEAVPKNSDDGDQNVGYFTEADVKPARSVVTRRNPWNTMPGIISPQYDWSPVYSRNLSAREVWDVQSIYAKYLGRLNAGMICRGKPMGQLTEKHLIEAFDDAMEKVDGDIREEYNDLVSGNVLFSSVISAEGRHQITGKLPSEVTDFINQEEALLLEYVGMYLREKLCMPPIAFVDYISKIPISHIRSKYFTCSRKHGNLARTGLPCRNSRYRSFDGSCNNLNNPSWGKSNVCHLRFLPAMYHDGISLPRAFGVDGEWLPTPRKISRIAHNSMEGDSYYNMIHFVWGQYVVHDISSTPQAVSGHKEGIKCCPARSQDRKKCFPIRIESDDEDHHIRNCINFVRSAPCPLCSIGPRQQVNLATSYIDQSVMYGIDEKTAKSLRTGQKGFLKYGFDAKGQPILPNSDAGLKDQCSKPGRNRQCFKSGDLRVNQHPGLQLIHMLFLRRHNYHAWNLYLVNPKASDETLFQEARRLTIAELQHITYNEYLPVVMGPELMSYYKLFSHKELFSAYDPTVDATTWNEFVTAAGRFGHTQIKSLTTYYDPYKEDLLLRDSFFNPTLLHEGKSDALIKGLLRGRSSVVDPFLSKDVKSYLYLHPEKEGLGGDLAAFNIARGRDHGIPPYYAFLEFCFNYKVRSWDDITRFIPADHTATLRTLYRNWQDIDLFTGGLAERKSIDADLGPTFACLVGIQFHHLKYGDRYFYSHYGQAGSFTRDQLLDIKSKVTLANFLCQTATNLDNVQKNAFLPESLIGNPRVFCNQSKVEMRLNYNLWKGLQ